MLQQCNTHPVLALLPLYPVLLPGGGPEEGRGDVREAAGDETPQAAVLLHGLPVVADHTGGAAEDLAAGPRVAVALAQPVLPLVLDNVGHVGWLVGSALLLTMSCGGGATNQLPLVTLLHYNHGDIGKQLC